MFAMKLKVLTYNIHKGFSPLNFEYTLEKIRSFIRESKADIVFLQELHGKNMKLPFAMESQLEYLADSMWTHFSYGKNAIYNHGDHGNAILSKFPIINTKQNDLSLHRFEKRGLLHCAIDLQKKGTIHLLCTHLNLLHIHRSSQYKAISNYILNELHGEKVILAGDFNDWNMKASKYLNKASLKEVFKELTGHYARTFPYFHPVLSLDRIYVKGFSIENASIHLDLDGISDHLAISCEIIV